LTRYIARRLLQAAVLSIGVLILTFALIRLAPGDPVAVLAGERSTAEYQQQLRRDLGLDRPLAIQLWRYLASVARGDLGFSFSLQQSVGSLVLQRTPATLLLMGFSLILSALLGIWVGVRTATRRHTVDTHVLTVTSLVGYSIPSFWLAEIFILVFAVRLQWFPLVGMTSLAGYTGVRGWLDVAWHLALPATTLTAFNLALFSRLTRAAMLEVLGQEYVNVARGKGLVERTVVYRHALRNAMLPVVTLFGLNLGALPAGFVLVETVFGWPGLGRLTFDAIASRDYPLISGMFIFISEVVILANLLTDCLYGLIDPRIRYQ
jgi:ABC-type dipeptide/oligopeptide/nickel transport system permease component